MRTVRNRWSALAVIASFVAIGAFAGGPAMASEPEFDPLAIVEAEGLLQSQPDTSARIDAAPDSASTLGTVESAIAPVEIVPVTTVDPKVSKDAVVYESEDHGIVTGVGSNGANAGFIVLKDAGAPTSYSFEIGDEASSLVLNVDGSVTVLDSSGAFVNYVQKPWAYDASGKELPTSFTVSGNTLTQSVSTEGATFPVVADPQTECGVGWCSIYFNRAETKAIAAGSGAGATAIAAGCAAINVYIGGLCAVGFGISAAVAQGAYAAGNCLGWFFTPFGNNPFVEPRGSSYCK